MRFLKVAFVMAIALCLTASVYAETQSVKVSGDLTIRGLMRDNYDLRYVTNSTETIGGVVTSFAQDGGGLTGVGTYPGANQAWWMSQTEVQVDAELTDCVSACVRIANERDWNVQNKVIVNQNTALWPNGFGGWATPDGDAEEFEIELDLAYVTLKNFIYQPLTVTIGRQDLWFGKGFIVGSNQLYNNWLRSNQMLNAPEYTLNTAFDAFKAVLDYDPWTITGVYAAILTNSIAWDDGVSLWGINVGYKFDCYKAEAEAYWFAKIDNSVETYRGARGSQTHTIGARGSMDPIENLTVSGELALQFGNYIGSRFQPD
ncbi:MAG: hypothetical protein NC933_01415 [Candidatus Omnitrophica bacterium]|nr:hypothetical protein [Candidatus Omnitrophota bacterium]